MAKKIMFQGTASSVGKSLLCAALCRILVQDGYSVAPFKSQNMALNSFVTADGLEMGRAQVMQAEAAGIEPLVEMNPILLKPTSDQGSQVVVMGKPVGNMAAAEYIQWKAKLLPVIDEAYHLLAEKHDVIVIEGAGSPAEINLRDKDLVNMGLACRLQAPVILAGDIDRGGVFASLYGTVELLQDKEKNLLKGVLINKFRGDPEVLRPGLKQLEDLVHKPVLGVIPYINLNLDDEDSVTERFGSRSNVQGLNIQVIRLPRISNFTDFNPLELYDDVNLSYISDPRELKKPDLLILPGSKNTIEDLLDLRNRGWEKSIRKYISGGGLLMGICGGFQMLGKAIYDPHRVESRFSEVPGFALLDINTVMEKNKYTRQVKALWRYSDNNLFKDMQEESLEGYEIHMGKTDYCSVTRPVYNETLNEWEGAVSEEGNVFGTYLHGIFDNTDWTNKLLNSLRRRKGLPEIENKLPKHYRQYKENEYNRLAEIVRDNMDIKKTYEIIGL